MLCNVDDQGVLCCTAHFNLAAHAGKIGKDANDDFETKSAQNLRIVRKQGPKVLVTPTAP
jgi:hypothetical protein